jgi:hypothetical protein
MNELYEVYIEGTKTISQKVVVDVEGVISTELVSVEVPNPITVGHYVVESLDVLKNDIFKGMTDFQFKKLPVAYGDISVLQSVVTHINARQLIETLKESLDEITFQNVLNFVFGKPLIEPPIIQTPILTESDTEITNVKSETTMFSEHPDITNALREQFLKKIPELQVLIEQKQQLLTQKDTMSLVDSFDVSEVSDNIQKLQEDVLQKQSRADILLQDQISFIEFKNILLPLLLVEIENLANKDIRGEGSHGRTDIRGEGSHGRTDIRGEGSHGRTEVQGAVFAGSTDIRGEGSHGRTDIRGEGSHGRTEVQGAVFAGSTDIRGEGSHGRTDIRGEGSHGRTEVQGAVFAGSTDIRGEGSHGRTDIRGEGSHGRTDIRGEGSHGRTEVQGAVFAGSTDIRGEGSHGRTDIRGEGSHGRTDIRGEGSRGRTDINDSIVVDSTRIAKAATILFDVAENFVKPVSISELDTMKLEYLPQSKINIKEDVPELFLGTSHSSPQEIIPEDAIEKSIVLSPSGKIPDREVINTTVSIVPNFGS